VSASVGGEWLRPSVLALVVVIIRHYPAVCVHCGFAGNQSNRLRGLVLDCENCAAFWIHDEIKASTANSSNGGFDGLKSTIWIMMRRFNDTANRVSHHVVVRASVGWGCTVSGLNRAIIVVRVFSESLSQFLRYT